ncbi:tetratricopeptide repeat-containing sensor histidine kinase [Fluviicola taffensis]|uniref:histidine kinase n=1 Tax=Fluviicola taffensis (strain DSM 16823 / NCIMB 13979 / RW262) TaxID=755732 RepID=F2IAQ1_FLUTR|nr:sensor histidine kinase [Fluviicola taffensis]AEA44206.1 histidine kinase [Fluviicola taffensis DSM 16823]
MSKRLPLVFFFLLIIQSLAAQKADLKKLEDLKIKIKQATYYDSSTVFSLGEQFIQLAKKLHKENEIGYIYQYYGSFNYYSNNLKEAKRYYAKSISIGKKTKDYKLINSTKIRLNFLTLDHDILKADNGFKELLKDAKKGNYIENQLEIYNGIGIMYEARLMYDKATESYLKGLRISEKHREKFATGYLLNNLALLKLKAKKYNEAKKDLERALILATETQESRLRLNVLNNLGLVTHQIQDFKGSIIHYKQTVIEAKKIGFPAGIAAAYVNLSSSYLDNKQLNEASRNSDSALAIVQTYRDPMYLITSFIMRGMVSVEQKDFQTAERCIDSVEFYIQSYNDPYFQMELIALQSKLASAQGNFKLAYELERNYSSLSDSIREVSNENEQTRLQTIYGKERLENELSDSKQRNKFLQTKSELKSANYRFTFLVIFSIFLVILGAIYIYNVRKSRKIKSLFSQKLIEQIDEERSRISKDLHDDIGQSLAVVKSKLNLFSTGKITKIDGVDLEIGDILEQTRVLSHQLHPAALEKIGLETALNSLIEKTQSGTDMLCTFEYELNGTNFSIETSSQIYRIIQECISNTIKHAHASALKVTLERKNGELIIQYRDNGIGISDSQDKNGLGLLTIRERTAIIGGRLDLKTGNNKGISLTITI